MRYIDSNVFIYAAIDDGRLGDAARDALRTAVGGDACTSALTVDEVLWAVKRLKGKPRASDVARKLLNLGIKVFPVERRDVEAALSLFDEGMDPRDAIHAAVAMHRKCKNIVSTDDAFANIPGIRHEHIR